MIEMMMIKILKIELGSISARVLINQSVRACEFDTTTWYLSYYTIENSHRDILNGPTKHQHCQNLNNKIKNYNYNSDDKK